jgi:hypothetical protein
MNLKTTLVLVILLVAGGALYRFAPELPSWAVPSRRAPAAADAGTQAVLEKELTADRLTRIEIVRGEQKRVALEKAPGGDDWLLPGRWPTRDPEVKQLVALLGGLRTRHAPEPITEETDLRAYGLQPPAVTVRVVAGGKEYRLAFGKGKAANRLASPTWLRLDDRPEAIRLGPGLIAILDRPAEYYQRRQLFPAEPLARERDAQEKRDRLQAQALEVKDRADAAKGYTLVRNGDEWELSKPFRDRLDPEKLRAVLEAVPDLWAEYFVERGNKDLADFGLKEPEQTIEVTRADGARVTLLVGKLSQTRERVVLRPPPPGMPRMVAAATEKVKDEYHYAKLQDNDQLFEIKAEKLKQDVLISAADLRDARVVRFQPQDVRGIELAQGGQKIVFTKEKSDWRMTEPMAVAADNGKVSDLLFKLSSLEAKDKESVRYQSDPKTDGLDKPAATIKLTIEEGRGEPASGGRQPAEGGAAKTRTVTLLLGRGEAAEAGQLFVKTEGWDRVSKVPDDGLLALARQPALAFRSRRVLDVVAKDLEKIEIQRAGETYALGKIDGTWKLLVPGQPEADRAKVNNLTDDLSRLEAADFVTDARPEETGLDQPTLTVTLTFSKESNQPARKLLVGKQRPGKPEYYARLEGLDEVFLLRQQLHDDLDQKAVAYRPRELWSIPPDGIASLRIQKEGKEEYRLDRDGGKWKITGPFEAEAGLQPAGQMAASLHNLRCQRFETNSAKDPAAYGLDKPYLRLTVVEKPDKERTLLIGKPVDAESKARFARLGDGEGVFVLDEKTVAALDHGALDLLDRNLFTLGRGTIQRVRIKRGDGTVVLEPKGDSWQVTESPVGTPFAPDEWALKDVLGAWNQLTAQQFAAYGPKVDWAKYGLDKPAVTITVTVSHPPEADKKAEPKEVTLALGESAKESPGGRYARLGDHPGVAILDPFVSAALNRGHLDFVDHRLLQFDAAKVTDLKRQMGGAELQLAKRDEGWQLLKPTEQRADDKATQELLDLLADLRASAIRAYPAKELQPFGLDDPFAVLTLRGADPKEEFVLKIGKAADEKNGDRFVLSNRPVAGQPAVGVLPGGIVRRLTAGPLAFRDRTLARFADADRATLERGPRKAVFAKVGGAWKLVEPVEAEAEQNDLEDLINSLARLRADELVAEKPDDLKPFGLAKPEARWRLQSGDKEVLQLLVGSKEKDGPRSYAKLANGDLVFLLDPKLSERLLAEYRVRSAWPTPLDAVQVEALTFRTPRAAFTLEKGDSGWQVAGKPETKVNPAAVNETLAALAGLRLTRFVQDKDTDLNLYGLDPAELIIEAETRTGKRVLHVGRPEGESKRRYARVPDRARPGVFVLSEADAARLVRDLSAFVDKPMP